MKSTMISALAAVLLVACGDVSDEITGPSSTTATLYFTLDEATCGAGNSGVLTLYVDGASVGTLTAQGGSKTPNYTVNGGTTIYVSAKWALSTGEVTWPRDNLKIPVGGTYNQILPCA